ncbi:MAG: hypothetical protein WA828_08675 [Coleofasciculaceae cyanobacterium]
MKLVIESTKKFEEELEAFSETEKLLIIEKMNQYFQMLSADKVSFYRRLDQVKKLRLINQYDSSLYTLKINNKIRLILTIDEDPIYDQTIITLFRVVKLSDISKAYDSVAESLYQDLITNQETVGVSPVQ